MNPRRSAAVAAPVVLALALAAFPACKPNPSECYEKGNAKACESLCETGKQEHMPACFEMRARMAVACVDGKGDCTAACDAWKNAGASSEDVKNVYVAKLGTDARVKALDAKCGTKK